MISTERKKPWLKPWQKIKERYGVCGDTSDEIEVARDDGFVMTMPAMVRLDGRDEGAMATVVEEEDITSLSSANHGSECSLDVATGGEQRRAGCIGEDEYVIAVEAKAGNEYVAHSMDVVDATMELVATIGIVAPHQRCQPLLSHLH